MLDTNICIYIIKNKPISVKERFYQFRVGEVILSSITVSELYYGAYKSQHIEKNLLALENFLNYFRIEKFDLNASIEYGKIRSELERKGKVIGGMDMLIAAHALSLDVTLITNNLKEFSRISGLKLDNWV